MEGYNFIFIDNEYWNDNILNNLFMVTMNKPEDIKYFKRIYRKTMKRYWNDEILGDFYEQLDNELNIYNISISKLDNVETYWSVMK